MAYAYEIDVTYEGEGDEPDETKTYRGYDSEDLPSLEAIVADWKSGRLVAQLRADPKIHVVGIKHIAIRKV